MTVKIMHQYCGLILLGSSYGMTDEYIRQIIGKATAAPDGTYRTQRCTYRVTHEDCDFLWRKRHDAWEKIAIIDPDGTIERA